MKQVKTEIDGKKYVVLVEDDEEDYSRGLVIGPPDALYKLDLPPDLETRLHNELFNRGLITRRDVMKRPNEVFAAWQSACSADVQSIVSCYTEK